MRRAWLIAAKDLRLRIRDRSAIIQAFVAPFALATIITLALGDRGDSFHPTYLYVDLDGGSVAQGFSDLVASPGFAEDFTVKKVKTRSEAIVAIEADEASAAFVLPEGTSDALQAGRPIEIEVVRNASSAIAADVAASIATGFTEQLNAGRLSVATTVASGGQPAPEQIQQLVAKVQQERLPIGLQQTSGGTKEVSAASYFGPSMAIFFLFYTVQFGARSLLSERREGTLARLGAAPVRPMTVIAGKAISAFILGLASIGTLMVAISLVFGADLGDPLAVAAVCIAIVFATMGLTALLISFARTEQQADSMGGLLAFGLALLGGNFIPINQAPELFRKLSLLTPNGWALRSLNDLIADGGGIETVVTGLVVMLAIGLVTSAIAAVRSKKLVIA